MLWLQLDCLLQSAESGLEGKIKYRGNTTLDSLYMAVLDEAFGDNDQEDDSKVQSILGAVTLATNPLSPSAIALLLSLDVDDILPFLSSLHSLIIQGDKDYPVRSFHKSFHDFITNQSRCTNPRFCVYPPDQHTKLLVGCLELMNQKLELNMCKLTDGVLNSEVKDLEERIEQHIDPALQYACKSWHKHLVDNEPAPKLRITPFLHQFLENKFTFWLEVLSVLGAAREAVDALEVVEKWVDVSNILLYLLFQILIILDSGVSYSQFNQRLHSFCSHIL